MNKLLMLIALSGTLIAWADNPTATGTLSADNTVLKVDVAEGETATFDATTLLANVSTVTNFYKTGKGTLDVLTATDISSYQGAITIIGGTYCYETAKALGDTTTGKGAPVYVKEGGAIKLHQVSTTDKSVLSAPKKSLYVEGTGPDGAGAVLIFADTADVSGYCLTTNIVLTGDATFKMLDNRKYLYASSGKRGDCPRKHSVLSCFRAIATI